MKLYCFPYAGGSATIYYKWKDLVDDSVEIVPVELAGRGMRFGEPLCDNMDRLIDDLYTSLEARFVAEDYMLYGHSMGSWIVYYLMNRIVKNGIRQPKQLYLSGKEAPHIINSELPVHKLNKNEFMEKIARLGGTPKEFFKIEEMLDIYVPILRNDYKVIETCECHETKIAFDCDITIFNGIDDDLNEEDINGWQRYTTKGFYVYHFEGGHFFIHSAAAEMLKYISKDVYRSQLLI